MDLSDDIKACEIDLGVWFGGWLGGLMGGVYTDASGKRGFGRVSKTIDVW